MQGGRLLACILPPIEGVAHKQPVSSLNQGTMESIAMIQILLHSRLLISMTQGKLSSVVELFLLPSKNCRRNVEKLVLQSFSELGEAESLGRMREWEALSSKMSSPSQLRSLSDNNHRLLLIEFIKSQAIHLYNNSYFNHAKISTLHLAYLKQIGPFYFTEIITIVNKLKLIQKHYRRLHQLQQGENHIDLKIIRILEMCDSKERRVNSNFNKFQAIVECEDDRDDLTKELGKMLRIAWSIEKRTASEARRSSREAKSISNPEQRLFHSNSSEVESLDDNYDREIDELHLWKSWKE